MGEGKAGVRQDKSLPSGQAQDSVRRRHEKRGRVVTAGWRWILGRERRRREWKRLYIWMRARAPYERGADNGMSGGGPGRKGRKVATKVMDRRQQGCVEVSIAQAGVPLPEFVSSREVLGEWWWWRWDTMLFVLLFWATAVSLQMKSGNALGWWWFVFFLR